MLRRACRGLAGIAFFLLGLSGGCWLLRMSRSSLESLPIASAKLAYLRAHPAQYDTLFIGSSRVQMHLDPALFDATTAELGRPTHSFNCGVLGMVAPEDSFVCEHLFALHPRGLRRIFLELGAIVSAGLPESQGTERAIAWHDFRRTSYLCRMIWAQTEKRAARLDTVREKGRPHGWRALSRELQHFAATTREAWPALASQFGLFAAHAVNLGSGYIALAAQLRPNESAAPGPDLNLGVAGNGFLPATEASPPAGLAQFAKDFAGRHGKPAPAVPLDAVSQENLEGMLRLVRAAGAEPILYIPPNAAATKFVPARPVGAPILDFSDATRWPELFETRHRFDSGHLNAEGAQIQTREFAEEWVRLK